MTVRQVARKREGVGVVTVWQVSRKMQRGGCSDCADSALRKVARKREGVGIGTVRQVARKREWVGIVTAEGS